MKHTIHILILAAAAAAAISCGTQRKAGRLAAGSAGAQLVLPGEAHLPTAPQPSSPRLDTLHVVDFDGREALIMKAVRDDDGEMVAHDVLDAAVVTARFRNVAERHGKVDLAFRIIVPCEMQDPRWQVRLDPDMYVLEDTLRLESILLTGEAYRKAQLRGYQQYERFLASIVEDTTRFINAWQLELFLERNLPEVYAFKSDTSFVSDELFASRYGVTGREAIEHYTDWYARRANDRRRAKTPLMYARHVRAPFPEGGVRLDTVVRGDGPFVYDYVQTVATRPRLRKVDVVLSGEVLEEGSTVYRMPRSEPLTFYISSLSTLADSTERYLDRVVERRVEAGDECVLDFAQGSSAVDLSLGDNASQMARVRALLLSLMEDGTYDLDSVVVTASASPEGTSAHNGALCARRGASVSGYLEDYMRRCRDSLAAERGLVADGDGTLRSAAVTTVPMTGRSGGENWEGLDRLVHSDGELSDGDKTVYFAARGEADEDRRESLLQGEAFYPRLRDALYPRLRTVRFDFHMHRKGMVRDTVHTTVLDTAYMAGVQALRDRDYDRAVAVLGPYGDWNAAVAYAAADCNASALAILEGMEPTARVNYLLALVHARTGDGAEAVRRYLWACAQDRAYVHRGNLDPEIAELVRTWGLDALRDDGENY